MPESSRILGEPKAPAEMMTSLCAVAVLVILVAGSVNSTPVATTSLSPPLLGLSRRMLFTSTPVTTVRLARPRTSGDR